MASRIVRDAGDRTIVHMAVPALGALAVEPAYVLVDTAIVGRLGTTPLGGLALASTVLLIVVGGCNFLAYGTTPRVAGYRTAGRPADAADVGVQALWLCVLLGVPLAVVLAALARPAATVLGGEGGVLEAAVTYLRISAVGIPFVLVALVAQGVLRGHANLRLPLAIAVVANAANVVLELIAVYGLDLGVAGSAWSTVIVQAGAAGAYLAAIAPHLRAAGSRRPQRRGLAPLLATGGHLLARVTALLAALTVATGLAARVDEATLAAHQIAAQMLSFLSLVLDALAIPAQTLVAERLGAGDPDGAYDVGARVVRLSLVAGITLAGSVAALSWLLPHAFTADPAVLSRATAALLVLAVVLVPAGVAMGLDGVLIGARDERFLARAMVVAIAVFLPLAGVVLASPSLGIVGVWLALGGWMAARAYVNTRRFADRRWLVRSA